jgi:acyl-CoA thioester hydrolase
MRWADMDLLGHVNNVRYLDYLTEGRVALLLEHGVDPSTARVLGHRIGFVAPMVFGRAPAQVRAWLVDSSPGGDRVCFAQEVSSETDGERTVHLRTETDVLLADVAADTFAESPRFPGHDWRPLHADLASTEQPTRHRYQVTLRERDLGVLGAARDDALLELFQESRIRYFMDLHTRGEEWSQHVVARTDLVLSADVRPGPSLEVRSWIAHVGRTSFVVRGDLCGRASGQVAARVAVVMVGFDAATGATAPMSPAQRARLQRELA